MYTDKKCRENQVVTINRFDKAAMKWANDNFFPRKYESFHMCPLTQLSTIEYPDRDTFDKTVEQLSMIKNFTVKKFYAHSNKIFMQLLKIRKYDLYRYHTYFADLDPFIFVILTSEKAVFMAPPGEPLTELEKLLSPFDIETWISISATLMFGFVSIQAVIWASRRLRNLCFGEKIGSPTMNLLNVFLCGGQAKVPTTLIARFIFLNIVIWSLMIRTCFQSLSYRALQMDSRHESMKTAEDMVENKFETLLSEYELLLDNTLFG